MSFASRITRQPFVFDRQTADDLRPRFADLRSAIAAAYPPARVNLDWI